jgi:hypothetical protein
MASENKTFHLGICMAGAITAGSYTAGVMDYLLETLERWQKQKDANKIAFDRGEPLPYPDTPMYDVVIDVISGASAGGMCASITSAMLVEGFTIDDVANKKSKMYKSWIELDDDGKDEGTIKKMLETDDIDELGFVSILNSKVLTNISRKAVKTLDEVKLPPYVDKKLDTILTLANLRGARYSINFRSYDKDKKHTMTLHRDFMHFKLDEKAGQQSDFLEMKYTNPNDIKLFQESAVATGAFPIGLRPRGLIRNSRYYYNKAAVTVGLSNLQSRLRIEFPKGDDSNYNSLNIDGGTFNNEPFGETERVLSIKAGKESGQDLEHNKTNRTILMIDPFPSNEQEIDSDDMKPGIEHVAPRIISSLREQSSFKTKDLLDALGDNNYLKYIIIPYKTESTDPLCCATIGAFGGFLYKGFREHDYDLGRRNCQQFLRKHFVLPYDKANDLNNNPIHQGWYSTAIAKFKKTDAGLDYLPIIPDVQKVIDGQNDPSEIIKPKLPEYPIEKLKELESLLSDRFEAIIDAVENMAEQKGEKKEPEVVKEWFKQSRFSIFFKSIGSFIGKPFVWFIIRKLKKELRKAMVDGVIKWILTDLSKAGLIKAK